MCCMFQLKSGPIDQFLGLLRGCREQRRHTIIIAVLNILYDINADKNCTKITCPYNYIEITMLYTHNNLYAHYMQGHGVLSHYVLQQYSIYAYLNSTKEQSYALHS